MIMMIAAMTMTVTMAAAAAAAKRITKMTESTFGFLKAAKCGGEGRGIERDAFAACSVWRSSRIHHTSRRCMLALAELTFL